MKEKEKKAAGKAENLKKQLNSITNENEKRKSALEKLSRSLLEEKKKRKKEDN